MSSTAYECPASPGGRHVWRLIDEQPAAINYQPQPDAPGYGTVTTHGTTRRWYCTHCRRVDSTYQPLT